jgi:putative transposase
MKLARPTLESMEVDRPSLLVVWPQGLCLDKGYDCRQIRELLLEFGYRAHIRSRGDETRLRQAGHSARRWVVERTHSWLNRFRGLLIRWAKKAKNYLAFLHFACGLITWRTIGLLG